MVSSTVNTPKSDVVSALIKKLLLNSFSKNFADIMMPIFLKFFNLIPKTGIFSEKWTTGMIIPIYKKKGAKENPDNYRGITLLSCFGKLFTSVNKGFRRI